MALITQSVQTAMAAERASEQAVVSQVVQVLPSSEPNNGLGGVPNALNVSAANFLASGSGITQGQLPQGRPLSSSVVVPSFV